MKIANYLKDDPKLTAVAGIVSLLIIVKFGIIVYLLLILLYYLVYLFGLEWDKNFNPKNPYRKLYKWLRGCFSLGNDVWLDRSLGSEFSALNHFCKQHKVKVTIYSEQIDAIAAQYNGNSSDSDAFKDAEEAIKRIEDMQKGNILRILPPVPASSAKPEPIKETVEDSQNHITSVNVSVNVPQPPKPPPPKKKFLTALTYYVDKCPTTAYISKDPELRIRVRHFMEQNEGKKIEIVMLGDFKKSCEYINRFRLVFIENRKKKAKAKAAKRKDKKAQIQEFLAAISDIAKT